jgi:hypothetical protein
LVKLGTPLLFCRRPDLDFGYLKLGASQADSEQPAAVVALPWLVEVQPMLEQRQCQLKDAPEHVGKITIRTDVDAAGKERAETSRSATAPAAVKRYATTVSFLGSTRAENAIGKPTAECEIAHWPRQLGSLKYIA